MSGTTAKFVRKVDRNNPLQYYLLENPNDRGARQTTVHGVARVRHDLVTKPPAPPPGIGGQEIPKKDMSLK